MLAGEFGKQAVEFAQVADQLLRVVRLTVVVGGALLAQARADLDVFFGFAGLRQLYRQLLKLERLARDAV